jgi:hypothetical protein
MRQITTYRFVFLCLFAISCYSFFAVNKEHCSAGAQTCIKTESITRDSEVEQAKKLPFPDLALVQKAVELLAKYL